VWVKVNRKENIMVTGTFFGIVDIRDGDFSPILELTKLEDVGLATHRHYKPYRDEIINIIKTRKGQ
jgi:hypothetical protein